MHRIYWEGPLPGAGEDAVVGEDEAVHALRVKRLRTGEAVQLLDGVGGIAAGTIASAVPGRRGGLVVRVGAVRQVAEVTPRVEVWAATPKGSRVDEMVEGMSEAGAAAWTPLRSTRSIVEPRATKLDRLMRLAVESGKQCGRAWFLRIEREQPFAEAIAPVEGTLVVLADASGGALEPPRAGRAGVVRVLIGPEGGWAPEEIERARAAGAVVAKFGPHAMRVETAAVVAAGVVLDRLGAG